MFHNLNKDSKVKVVTISKDGSLILNWDLLPSRVANDLDLRDKIFKKLQEEYPPENLNFNSKLQFQINKFVLD